MTDLERMALGRMTRLLLRVRRCVERHPMDSTYPSKVGSTRMKSPGRTGLSVTR